MWIKYLIIILLFFIFSIIQASFLPYFSVMENTPNIIFTLFFIIIFFEKNNQYYEGFFGAITGGFFLDIFLSSYFGLSIILLLAIYFFKKIILYFLKEDRDKYPIFYFIPIFLSCFVLYEILLYLFSILFNYQFNFGSAILIKLAYNLIFACIGFYLYKKITNQNTPDNQLKLFN